ncbi:ATP-dependent Clp protease adaptor ClpS [Bacteroidota bacterium]
MGGTQELPVPDIGEIDDTTFASKVILYNDDWHTFDEVINQIMKAAGCSKSEAEGMTWEVHNKGQTCVFEGDLPECLRVSSILEEIALHTQVEY